MQKLVYQNNQKQTPLHQTCFSTKKNMLFIAVYTNYYLTFTPLTFRTNQDTLRHTAFTETFNTMLLYKHLIWLQPSSLKEIKLDYIIVLRESERSVREVTLI